jgi:hypothetical protein
MSPRPSRSLTRCIASTPGIHYQLKEPTWSSGHSLFSHCFLPVIHHTSLSTPSFNGPFRKSTHVILTQQLRYQYPFAATIRKIKTQLEFPHHIDNKLMPILRISFRILKDLPNHYPINCHTILTVNVDRRV